MSERALSIVVPVHNAERTLDECLASVVAALPENSEIIIINDGSHDASAEIALRWAHRNPTNIRVINQLNRGRGATRNIGIEEASGTYIGFVDADDTIDPTMFSKMLARATETDADIVVCDYAAMSADMGRQLFVYDTGSSDDFGNSWRACPGLIRKFGASSCNKIVRVALINDTHSDKPHPIRYPEHLEIEDVATLIPLAFRAKLVEKIDEVLYFYRHHTIGSISHSYDEHYLEVVESIKLMNARIEAMKLGADVVSHQLWLSLEHIFRGRFVDLFPNAPFVVSTKYASFAFSYLDSHFPAWDTSDELNQVIQSSSHRWLLKSRRLFPLAIVSSKIKHHFRAAISTMR